MVMAFTQQFLQTLMRSNPYYLNGLIKLPRTWFSLRPNRIVHYTRCIMPKRVTSLRANIRVIAPEQHSYFRNVAAVASHRQRCVRFDQSKIKPQTSWSSGNAFVSGAGGRRFKPCAGQIELNVANGLPQLRHFFEKSSVV